MATSFCRISDFLWWLNVLSLTFPISQQVPSCSIISNLHFCVFLFSASGKKWWCLHLHPAWTWRGQVWLWEAWGALAADPYSRDHHDQCYLHVGRPQWRLSCQCGCSCKCPQSLIKTLSGWHFFTSDVQNLDENTVDRKRFIPNLCVTVKRYSGLVLLF